LFLAQDKAGALRQESEKTKNMRCVNGLLLPNFHLNCQFFEGKEVVHGLPAAFFSNSTRHSAWFDRCRRPNDIVCGAGILQPCIGCRDH